MLAWCIRVLGASLAAAGLGCLLGGWHHLGLAAHEDVYLAFHQAAAVQLMLAGLLLCLCGARLAWHPALGQQYPFLIMGRFWRWLLFGLLAVFCTLGLLLPGQDQARYPCRAACLLWLALLLSPLLLSATWRDRLSGLFRTRSGWLVDLAAGNLVLLAILLELGLRGLTLWTGQDALLVNRAAGCRLTPGVYKNGLRANSLGFADEEWTKEKQSGVLRIAALGDSFSAGTGVAYEKNYLTRLEAELGEPGEPGGLGGVEVCNFGVCGTGPREYQQLLSSLVWEYQPDLVLVPIFIGNDITERIATPEVLKFHPDALYIELLGRRFGRLTREWWRQSLEGDAADRRNRPGPQLSQRTYLELTAGHLVVCRAAETSSDRERWRQALQPLQRLIADCQDHGVPVVFVLIPAEFQVNAALRKEALAVRGWSEADLDLLLPQRRLTEFCVSHEVPCLDLQPRLAVAGGAAHIRNDGHWNARGHALAAEAVGAWLRQQIPLLLHPPIRQIATEDR